MVKEFSSRNIYLTSNVWTKMEVRIGSEHTNDVMRHWQLLTLLSSKVLVSSLMGLMSGARGETIHWSVWMHCINKAANRERANNTNPTLLWSTNNEVWTKPRYCGNCFYIQSSENGFAWFSIEFPSTCTKISVIDPVEHYQMVSFLFVTISQPQCLV